MMIGWRTMAKPTKSTRIPRSGMLDSGWRNA
jgi:hypothetical protein